MQSKFSTPPNPHIIIATVAMTADEYTLATGETAPSDPVFMKVTVDLRKIGDGYRLAVNQQGTATVLGGITVARLKEGPKDMKPAATPRIDDILDASKGKPS